MRNTGLCDSDKTPCFIGLWHWNLKRIQNSSLLYGRYSYILTLTVFILNCIDFTGYYQLELHLTVLDTGNAAMKYSAIFKSCFWYGQHTASIRCIIVDINTPHHQHTIEFVTVVPHYVYWRRINRGVMRPQ